MTRYIFLRLVDAVPTVLLVLTLVFVAMRILPGDPAVAALGDLATVEQLESFRERMGLNEPLWVQYFTFLGNALTLDFGQSMMTGSEVVDLIAYNLPYTIELTIASVVLGVVFGIPFGIWAATNANQSPDAALRGFSLIGYSIPDFYLGAVLLVVFSLNLGLFPISGGGEGFVDRMHHVFLPALALAFIKAAFLGRLTRAALLEVLGKDYVRTARAKGASERRTIYRHGLRNALLPLTTGLGLTTLAALSGSVAVEMVFNRPGIGKLLISAIAERDYAVIQAGVTVFALFVVAINVLMDLVYAIVDPRIRTK